MPTRPFRSGHLRIAALLCGLLLAPCLASAAEPTGLGYGLSLGYGYGVAPREKQRGRDVQDVRTLAIDPYLHLPLRAFGDGSRWYHGRLDGLLQASILVELEPQSGSAAGGVVGLRYLLGEPGHLRPYVEGGLGIGHLGFDLQSQDNGFSFFIHTALGARYPLGDRFGIIGSLLWQHVSNANTHPPNLGIDTVGFRVGLEFR